MTLQKLQRTQDAGHLHLKAVFAGLNTIIILMAPQLGEPRWKQNYFCDWGLFGVSGLLGAEAAHRVGGAATRDARRAEGPLPQVQLRSKSHCSSWKSF